MFRIGRVFMIRVPEGSELLDYLNMFAARENIVNGYINLIGSLKNPVIGYYNTAKGVYEEIELKGFYELASGIGNISLKDDKPYTHLHVVLGGPKGETYAGHLIRGEVYIVEATITETIGEKPLERTKHGNLQPWPTKK